MRAVCLTHLILFDLITLIIFGDEALHYAVFSILLPLPSSWVQIFSSAPCPLTPSIYVLSLLREAKFHAPTKQEVKLWFRMF